MKPDLRTIKESVDIVDIIGKYIELEKKGSEYKGMCPWHNDTKPSLNVNQSKQVWFCPACGDNKKGDVFDFLVAIGNSLPDAIRIVQGDDSIKSQVSGIKTEGVNKKVKPVEWKQIRPLAECTDFTHFRNGKPDAIYAYRDIKGLVGYVCRFNLPDGGKETLPLCYMQHPDGNSFAWRYHGFASPQPSPRGEGVGKINFDNLRPLYNSDLVSANPDLPVIVVEGEKVADWMNERSGGKFIAVTWVGGSNQVDKTSFEQLNGKKLLFCMDNDEPGSKCMTYVFDTVVSNFKKWGEIPANSPKGWDMADSKFTPQQTQDFVRRSMRVPAIKKHKEDEQFFTYLGFEKSDNQPVFIFYGKQSKTIFRLNAASMTKSTLVCLAPPIWWETILGSFKNTDGATNLLVNTSYKVGIYSPKNVRGRGAWYDDGRVVIHAGDKLIVDGVVYQLGELDTNYIYEIGDSFNFNTENPLTTKDASKILAITKLLNWERGVNAYLLAGWCVIAPVCGALNWRPHVWLTGSASVGKSWVFRHIIRALCGDTILDVQGATTEAGIRQSLGFDAMPVAFDEIDGNDARAQARIQENLELARSASADDTGKIIKGSASHNAKSFHIRSCFAFSSISIGIDKGSDRRRITTLSLVSLPDKEVKAKRWEELQALHNQVIGDNFVMGLHARTIKLLPIILENSKTFNNALVKVLGTQAMGDQIGPMLAGAYSLSSESLISYEGAVKFIEAQDWKEENEAEKVKDEMELFKFLTQWPVRCDGWGNRTVSELISTAGMLTKKVEIPDGTMTSDIAQALLRRIGIRIKDKFILISNDNSEIKTRLKDTRWVKNYGSILRRLPDADSDNQRFTGASERCVKLPISLIL
jgi:putative DNA primase/helicase